MLSTRVGLTVSLLKRTLSRYLHTHVPPTVIKKQMANMNVQYYLSLLQNGNSTAAVEISEFFSRKWAKVDLPKT